MSGGRAVAVALVVLVGGCDDGTDGAAPTTTAAERAACSASGLSAELEAQAGLPETVGETRRAIAKAAVACDYARLAELALASDFTYSFGDGGDPAMFWRDLEEAGEEPLRFLVELLSLPFGIEEAEARIYQWPSDPVAVGGRHGGYRIGIAEAGDWLFFVAGD